MQVCPGWMLMALTGDSTSKVNMDDYGGEVRRATCYWQATGNVRPSGRLRYDGDSWGRGGGVAVLLCCQAGREGAPSVVTLRLSPRGPSWTCSNSGELREDAGEEEEEEM
jgi:hypothetical protein